MGESGTLASGLFYRAWCLDAEARAVVLISHGLGEHSGRYEHVAEAFNKKGFHVFALDHLGHGHSPGKRAYINRFDDLTSGINALRAEIARQAPDLPVFLLGHSMGGLIAASAVLEAEADYQGLLLTGPALQVPTPPPAWQVLLLKFLSVVAPSMKALEIDAATISRDNSVVEAYIADPLVHHENIPARMVVSLFNEGARVLSNAADISLPVLLLHGAEDQLTSVSASQDFVNALGSSDKRCTVYEGMYHELFNEPEQDDILQTCTLWMEERLANSH